MKRGRRRMAIFRHFVGSPRPDMPDNANQVFSQSLHYLAGTQMTVFYSDDPDSSEDKAEIEKAKKTQASVNGREVPCWM